MKVLLVFDIDVGIRSEMLVVGDDSWTDLGALPGLGLSPYAVTVDNEVYVQGEPFCKVIENAIIVNFRF